MASEATLKFLLVGEDRSAGKALRGAGKDADRASDKFKRLGKVAAVGLAGGLIAGAGAALKLSKAAAEDEKAAVRLETSLRNATGATTAQVAATEDWITSLGKSTGITDDELRPAVGRLSLATKDLGKAQDLARLAMDVSVGTGKSLESITTALAKAQTGNIAGLGRLGIATKNADGKTKSLKEITADLSTLYGGQAARAADTAAGKQKILTTRMGELGETIGAKVQPLMLKATDAALKLADEFENGTGAGGEIRDVLEDVADAGKAVFEFFDSIPGPVKKYGAELAVAAVVMSKFRGLTGPVSAGLSTMVTNFKSAETRAAGLKKGLAGLNSGARNLAGAGGMVLLADSADEAGTKMGTLKAAAGGAALGFAVGGPVGAAVGGLAGGLISLATATDGATESTKISIPSWREYGATLDGVSASTSKATREMVLQRLEKSGLLKATRELGLSDREAVNAMTGGTAARRKLTDALSRNRTLTVEQQHALEKETGAVGAARLATLKRNVALAETGAELKAAKEELRKFMKAPADKRIGIHGVEQASAQLIYLQKLLNGVFASKRNNAASTGDPTADLLLGVGAYEIPGKNPADGGTILSGGRLGMAYGGTVAGQRAPYGDKVMKLLAPGEEVISNRNGQADRFRPLLKAINAGGMANGGSVGAETSPVPLFDYRQLAQEIVSAMQRGAPLVRLSDAGRGAYQAGASF